MGEWHILKCCEKIANLEANYLQPIKVHVWYHREPGAKQIDQKKYLSWSHTFTTFPKLLSPVFIFPSSRELAERLGRDASDPLKSTDLQPDLDQLQALLDGLNIIYNAKKNALVTSVSANDKGQCEHLVVGCSCY